MENQATLKQTEHFRCNYIEWDPSGRYACTAVSQPVTGSHWKAQMDNGFQLFSFQARAFDACDYFPFADQFRRLQNVFCFSCDAWTYE